MSIQANEGESHTIYPTNGKNPTAWGTHYGIEARKRIISDIVNGTITIEEMAEMLNLGKSYIRDWGRSLRPDVFGPPRDRPSKQVKLNRVSAYTRTIGAPGTYGQQYTQEQRRNIVRAILLKQISIEDASAKYRIYKSKLEYWCKSRTYATFPITDSLNLSAPIVTPSPAKPSLTDTDRLLANPEHARLVIGLLLNDSPIKAQAVAKALLAR